MRSRRTLTAAASLLLVAAFVWATAGAGKELVLVEMTVARKGTDMGLGPLSFVLKDGEGTGYPQAPTSGEGFIFHEAPLIKVGTPAQVKVAFEVPRGKTGLILGFAPYVEGAADDEGVDIPLD